MMLEQGKWQEGPTSALPNTSVLCWPLAAGHYRRAGKWITLAELLLAIGSTHSLMDIYFWYYHAQRLVRKRDHPTGSVDHEDAARLRKKELGCWGLGAAEHAGWHHGRV